MVRLPSEQVTPKRVQALEKDLKQGLASVARSFARSVNDLYDRILATVRLSFYDMPTSDARFAAKTHTHDASDVVSGTLQRPVNTSSVQADQFLGGSFTGTSGTFSGPVSASQGAFTGPVYGSAGVFTGAVSGSDASFTGRGTFPAGINSTGARNNQVTNGYVAAYIDSAGNFGFAPSTRASKDIGAEYAVDMPRFLGMKLYNWQYKNGGMKGIGPIADDLELAGLAEFLTYSTDGKLQGLRYEALTMGLWSAYVQSRTSTLAEFNKRSVQTKTVTGMTALAVGGTKPYTITWDKPFADTNYAVVANVYSSSGVLVSGAVAASLPSSRTMKDCIVQVTSGVSLLAGQTLVVEGIHT